MKGLKTLSQLTELNLRNNMIEKVQELKYLRNLNKLDLANNIIQTKICIEDI